jgi:hypothetical protein
MKRRLFFVGLMMVLLSTFVLTGTSLAAGTPSNPVLSVLFCTLRVEFDAQAAGVAYNVQIWDDLELLFNPIQTSSFVGQTMVFTFDFGDIPIQQGIPGIGILIFADSNLVSMKDPYTDLDAPCAAFQANEPGCDLLPLPSQAVGGAFVQTAPLYWAPGEPVQPALSIEAGKTAWVIGPDATGKWYKIAWACDFLWVPANTLGPNFDNVWQGRPLPTNAVK